MTTKEKGQGLFEYALILSIVSIALILILTIFGVSLQDIYCFIITNLGFDGPACIT